MSQVWAGQPKKVGEPSSIGAGMKRLMTVTEAAEYLHCCSKTIRRRIKDGELQAHNHAQRILITEEAIKEYLQKYLEKVD
jgi:excisionase family DNA binding protein